MAAAIDGPDPVILMSIKDPNRPRRKVALAITKGMQWDAFIDIVCRKLQLRGVTNVIHAESGRRVATAADLQELQDIDNIVVEETPMPQADRLGPGVASEPATIVATAVPLGERTPTGGAASAGDRPMPVSARKALWRQGSGGGSVAIDVGSNGPHHGGVADEDESKRDRRLGQGLLPRWLSGIFGGVGARPGAGLPVSVAPATSPGSGGATGIAPDRPWRMRRKHVRRLAMAAALLICVLVMVYLYSRIADLREDGRLGVSIAGVVDKA